MTGKAMLVMAVIVASLSMFAFTFNVSGNTLKGSIFGPKTPNERIVRVPARNSYDFRALRISKPSNRLQLVSGAKVYVDWQFLGDISKVGGFRAYLLQDGKLVDKSRWLNNHMNSYNFGHIYNLGSYFVKIKVKFITGGAQYALSPPIVMAPGHFSNPDGFELLRPIPPHVRRGSSVDIVWRVNLVKYSRLKRIALVRPGFQTEVHSEDVNLDLDDFHGVPVGSYRWSIGHWLPPGERDAALKLYLETRAGHHMDEFVSNIFKVL